MRVSRLANTDNSLSLERLDLGLSVQVVEMTGLLRLIWSWQWCRTYATIPRLAILACALTSCSRSDSPEQISDLGSVLQYVNGELEPLKHDKLVATVAEMYADRPRDLQDELGKTTWSLSQRGVILNALAVVDRTVAEPSIIKELSAGHPLAVGNAARLAGDLRVLKAKDELTRVLHNGTIWEMSWASYALGKMLDADVAKSFESVLRGGNEGERYSVILFVPREPEVLAISLLKVASTDPAPKNRALVAFKCSEHHTAKVRDILRTLASDRSQEVRRVANAVLSGRE